MEDLKLRENRIFPVIGETLSYRDNGGDRPLVDRLHMLLVKANNKDSWTDLFRRIFSLVQVFLGLASNPKTSDTAFKQRQ